jgi:hypothetical protein
MARQEQQRIEAALEQAENERKELEQFQSTAVEGSREQQQQQHQQQSESIQTSITNSMNRDSTNINNNGNNVGGISLANSLDGRSLSLLTPDQMSGITLSGTSDGRSASLLNPTTLSTSSGNIGERYMHMLPSDFSFTNGRQLNYDHSFVNTIFVPLAMTNDMLERTFASQDTPKHVSPEEFNRMVEETAIPVLTPEQEAQMTTEQIYQYYESVLGPDLVHAMLGEEITVTAPSESNTELLYYLTQAAGGGITGFIRSQVPGLSNVDHNGLLLDSPPSQTFELASGCVMIVCGAFQVVGGTAGHAGALALDAGGITLPAGVAAHALSAAVQANGALSIFNGVKTVMNAMSMSNENNNNGAGSSSSNNNNNNNNNNDPNTYNTRAEPANGLGVNDPPQRIYGPWTLEDIKRASQGKTPLQLGGKIQLHHADQMPGSAIHEVFADMHNVKGVHPNKFNQGVTDEIRKMDRQLHWWLRAQEMGYIPPP